MICIKTFLFSHTFPHSLSCTHTTSGKKIIIKYGIRPRERSIPFLLFICNILVWITDLLFIFFYRIYQYFLWIRLRYLFFLIFANHINYSTKIPYIKKITRLIKAPIIIKEKYNNARPNFFSKKNTTIPLLQKST